MPLLLGNTASSNISAIPLGISNLSFWYDASDAASITSSGGLISQWNDKSGNGYHATASGALRPTLTSSYLNGNPVVTFGGSQYLTATTSQTSNAFTHFIVAAKTSASSGAPNEYSRLLSLWNTDGAGAGADYTSTDAFLLSWYSSSTFSGVAGPGSAVYRNSTSIAATKLSIGTPHLSLVKLDGINVTHTLDSDTVTGTTSSTAVNANRQTIGAGGSGGGGDQFLIGWVAESIMYNKVLNSTEVGTITNYLRAKWGVGLVFNFDASVSSSYPGSGSTWTDISGAGRSISLSGTSYSSANGGSIVFNGSSSYGTGTITTLGGTYTVEVALKFNAWNDQGADPLALTSGSGDAHGLLMESNYSGSLNSGANTIRYLHRYSYGSGANSDDMNSLTALSLNTPYVITYVRTQGSSMKVYINGVLNNTITPTYGAFDSDLTRITVGRLTQTGSARYFNGNLYSVRAYSYALTATEVAARFETLRVRLGI